MTGKDRRNYCLNRCYAAYYDEMPNAFKTIRLLRYPGLALSVLANPELYKIQNLTPERTDVMLTSTNADGERTNADFDEIVYALKVYHDFNFTVKELRFTGKDIFAYRHLADLLKELLRLPKYRNIPLVINGETMPNEAMLTVMKNPEITAIISPQAKNKDALEELFRENEINWYTEEDERCHFCDKPYLIFVDGKLFRCPKAAERYFTGEDVKPEEYCDLLERKLEIPRLRLKTFDFTYSDPPCDCADCNGGNT